MGRTPFELMNDAVVDDENGRGDSQSVALWREYVRSVKGRRQVTTSRGLSLKDDEELRDEPAEQIALLGPGTVLELDRRRMLPELLDAIETSKFIHPRVITERLLSTLNAKDWRILRDFVPFGGAAPEERPPPKPPPEPDLRANRPWWTMPLNPECLNETQSERVWLYERWLRGDDAWAKVPTVKRLTNPAIN